MSKYISTGPLFDVCEKKHGGNPESRAAFVNLKDRLTLEQEIVFDFIKSCGEHGATTDEIAVHFDGNPNDYSGRVSELKIKGRIVKCGTRPTRSGNPAAILKAV